MTSTKNIKNFFDIKLVFLPFGIMFLLSIISFILLDFENEHTMQKRFESELFTIIRACDQEIQNMKTGIEDPGIRNFLSRIGTASNTRITIIDSEGKVTGDSRLSDKEIASLDKHLSRPEIISARESGFGISKRYSETLKTDMLYVAKSFSDRGNNWYIRTSKTLYELKHAVFQQRMTMAMLSIIIFFISLSLTILTIIYLSRRISIGQEFLEKRIRERTSHISILNRLGTMLTACDSIEEALEIVGKTSEKLLPDFFGALSLYRASKNALEVASTWNGDWQGDRFFQPQECWGLRSGKPHFSYDGRGIVSCTHSGGSDSNPMLCIPMSAQGETMGVMHLTGKNLDHFTEEAMELASALVEHTGLAIANLQLRDSLRKQATHDTLTGLYNRRFLMEYFETELSRAQRRNQNLGVLMLDIDHFKRLNDTLGHDAGDFVLNEIGSLLRHTMRSEDITCRYGGEEFVILLPETNIENSVKAAEKIHNKLRQMDLKFESSPVGDITVSIGVATFPENGNSPEILIREADRALYHAKETGRNRTVVSGFDKTGT